MASCKGLTKKSEANEPHHIFLLALGGQLTFDYRKWDTFRDSCFISSFCRVPFALTISAVPMLAQARPTMHCIFIVIIVVQRTVMHCC